MTILSSMIKPMANNPGPTDDFWYTDPKSGYAYMLNGTTAEAAMRNSAVYDCVKLLSEDIAKLPLHVYRRLPDGGKERAYNHPLYDLLKTTPNSWQTSTEYRQLMQAHVELRGNAYSRIISGPRGFVDQLEPINPDDVLNVERKPNGRLLYKIRKPDLKTEELWQEDIFHLRGFSLNGLTGISTIGIQSEAINIGIAAQQFQSSSLRNGISLSGVFTHPNTLSPKAKENLKESIDKRKGSKKAGGFMILEEGMKWQEMSMTLKDAQFVELRKLNRTEIAAIFRVPPHKIGDLERATFCMPADVEIFTRTGPKSIASIKRGDSVWSYSGNKMVLAKVNHSICSGIDEILEIKTTNRTIRCNAQHRILVRKKYPDPQSGVGGYQKIKWQNEYIPAGKLKSGDTVIAINSIPQINGMCPTRKATVGFMEFCGLLLGDGNVYDGSICIARANNARYMNYYRDVIREEFRSGGREYNSGEKHGGAKLTQKQVDEIKSLKPQIITISDIARKFNANICTVTAIANGHDYHTEHCQATITENDLPKLRTMLNSRITVKQIADNYNVCNDTIRNIIYGKSWNEAKISELNPVFLVEGDRQTRFSSVNAASELKELGLSGTARTKTVPDWIFQLNESLRLAFLRGYLDSDGHVDKKGRIKYASVNQKMLSQIRHLCMSCNVPVTNIRTDIVNTTLPNRKKCISTQHSFTCSDPGSNRKIGSHDDRYIERLNNGKPFDRKARKYPRYGGRGFESNCCELSKIISIKTVGREPVYDLEVEGTHSFIANGVVVHNSNIEHQALEYVIDGLMARLVRWEQAITRDLIQAKNIYFAEFLVDALLRGDLKTRYEAYSVGINCGVLNPDEARSFENMNPRPGGNKYWAPLNMEMVGKQNERMKRVLSFASSKLANKELVALRKASAKFDKDAFVDWANEFYQGYRQSLADTLQISDEKATAYVESALNQIRESERFQDLLCDWETKRAGELTRLALAA